MLQADSTASLLSELVRERILLLDGAMGTMIQRLGLDEAGVRGERFADHHKDLKNFSDILCLTHPEKITDIHRAYFEAGSDIVETNSFGASPVGMIEFDLSNELVAEINHAAVACARKAADEWSERTPGSSLVLSPVRLVRRPSSWRSAPKSTIPRHRDTTFPEMVDSYRVTGGVVGFDAGVDILLPETAIDTLNLKACLFAIEGFFNEAGGRRVPVIASGTFADGGPNLCQRHRSCRSISGQRSITFPLLWQSE